MVLLVADMLIKVVGTVISSTVYDVRDAISLQYVFILSYEVTAKIKEAIDDFRADALVIFIFILLPGSALHIEVFI
jgi:hypothetical protein